MIRRCVSCMFCVCFGTSPSILFIVYTIVIVFTPRIVSALPLDICICVCACLFSAILFHSYDGTCWQFQMFSARFIITWTQSSKGGLFFPFCLWWNLTRLSCCSRQCPWNIKGLIIVFICSHICGWLTCRHSLSVFDKIPRSRVELFLRNRIRYATHQCFECAIVQ